MVNLAEYRGLDEELLVDTSEAQSRYLLISKSGHPIKLAPAAYYLVRGVYQGRSFESLAQEFSEKGGKPVSSTDIEAAYNDVSTRLASIEKRAGDQLLSSGFWLRFRLIPAQVVERLAIALSRAYHPAIAALLLFFIIATFTAMLRGSPAVNLEGGAVWGGYLLFVLSLLVHEFGHASACARFGAKPSDIGFTMYLVYPAFYSDVTSAWQLKRWQRVIVDLGGTFFQFVVAGMFALAYLVYGGQALQAAFVMIGYGALFSLNPIFKFDGYWVLADALGVTDLARQPAAIFKRLLAKVRGQKTAKSLWPWWVTLILFVYAPVAFLFWGYFILRLVPFLVATTVAYPQKLVTLWTSLVGADWSVALREAGTFLATTLLLVVIWYGTLQMLYVKAITLRHRWWHRRAIA